MKKMWMIAAVVCAALMAPCGGNKAMASNPTAIVGGVTMEDKTPTNPVVAKATELAIKVLDAMKTGNQVLVNKIVAEGDAYMQTLSEADQKLFEETVNKVAEKVMSGGGVEPVAKPAVVEPVNIKSTAHPAVVAKATELTNRLIVAMKSNDMPAAEKIAIEADAYMKTLSEAEKAIFEEASNAIAAAAGLL